MLVKRTDSNGIPSTLVRYFLALAVSIAALGNQARASFTEVTTSVLPIPVMGNGMPPILDGGAVTGDFDNDGDIDIFIPTREARDLYFRNNGDGSFDEIGVQSGFTAVTDGYTAGAADIDNDGDLDIYVPARVQLSHYLYINDGNGFFTEEAAPRGASIPGGRRFGRGVAFGDYDKDGYLDIFVGEWLEPWAPLGTTGPVSRLLRNRGPLQPGYFDDVTISAQVVQNNVLGRRAGTHTHTPRFSDLDRDGWPDLVLTSDFGESRLYWNNGDGTFTDGTVAAGFGTGLTEMGMEIADISGDGLLDIVTTSIFFDVDMDGIADNYLDGNRLYVNNGDRTFTDGTDLAGIRNGYWGWGVAALDYDNDGDLDLVQANGWRQEYLCDICGNYAPEFDWDAVGIDPTMLFENDGSASFTDVAVARGIVSNEWSMSVIAFDYDGDGDQDVLQINDGAAPNLFRNDEASDNDWLQIKLSSNGSAPNGVGAYVTVTPSAGGPSQTREMSASGTWMAQDASGILHFGFGDLPTDSTVDVLIDWPSGTQTFHAAQALNQTITYEDGLPAIEPGQGLVVVGGDGDGPHVAGSEVTIAADPADEHYHFAFWSSNGGGVFTDPYAAQTTFTVPEGATVVTAVYLPGVAPDDTSVGVARRWNEVLLQAIRKDFARPTIHARNLFHISAAMYDAWAAFADQEETWLLGHSRAGVDCTFDAMSAPVDLEEARREAISHAAYRLLLHRFVTSPGVWPAHRDARALMAFLGYNGDDNNTDYAAGSAAALGNHIAQCYIDFGYADGANEAGEYKNQSYQPVNAPLKPELPGNPNISNLNRWQPLSLVQFIDQSGNQVSSAPAFLGPEWGQVIPFALQAEDRVAYERDGFDYLVYHDPGAPPTIDGILSDSYKWAFSLVSIWSSHLDYTDGVMMDISPASLGNIQSYPTQFEHYPQFYNTLAGGDASTGYSVNPVTAEPYTPQMVPRGDYARVLAEFWADGPDSETPPGHWFTIMNAVNDHPLSTRRFAGTGPELDILAWEVKSYFTLGGAMHDAAISAWGVKGWYDYIRPIAALRAMADRGQSSDPLLPSFHENGIPLQPGYIELVGEGDPLAGNGEHIGKIKVLAWRGPDYIVDPMTDEAGVGWILAENWWPYQRPTFVTPPFAGYVSGHSTFSRAAAEVMTALTGDPYFPGGMSGFEIPSNEFLVFEEGPSVDMTLQWATYRDASDQCSLSRIWGGIHPPVDDLPGRLMGIEIGIDAFNLASEMFSGNIPPTVNLTAPLDGTSYDWGASIELTAVASDTDGSVARVEFYQGSTLLGEATSAPYTFTWAVPDVGNYTVTAVAIDDAGASTVSEEVSVSVILDITGC